MLSTSVGPLRPGPTRREHRTTVHCTAWFHCQAGQIAWGSNWVMQTAEARDGPVGQCQRTQWSPTHSPPTRSRSPGVSQKAVACGGVVRAWSIGEGFSHQTTGLVLRMRLWKPFSHADDDNDSAVAARHKTGGGGNGQRYIVCGRLEVALRAVWQHGQPYQGRGKRTSTRVTGTYIRQIIAILSSRTVGSMAGIGLPEPWGRRCRSTDRPRPQGIRYVFRPDHGRGRAVWVRPCARMVCVRV